MQHKRNESRHLKCFRQVGNMYFVHLYFGGKFHLIHPDMCKTRNNIYQTPCTDGKLKTSQLGKIFLCFTMYLSAFGK
jgi:hypothetical protein